MSNKNIIEEKVEAIMQEMYAVDEPNMTDEQVDRIARSILTKALTEVAAHQQASNIEAVEKAYYDSGLRISALFERDEKLCIEVGDATPEVVSIIDNRKFLDALAALRPQQQEDEKAEVPVWRKCSKCDKSMDVLHRGTNFCLEHFNEVITALQQQEEV